MRVIWYEWCPKDITFRSAPQGERSNMHKVTKVLHAHRNFKNDSLPGFRALLSEVFKLPRLSREIESEASEVLHIPPRKFYHQVQNQTWRQIHKTRLSTCSKFCSKSPNIKPATTNHFQHDLWFQPRLANVLPTPRQCHGCHADGKKVSDVVHLSRQMAF